MAHWQVVSPRQGPKGRENKVIREINRAVYIVQLPCLGTATSVSRRGLDKSFCDRILLRERACKGVLSE